jgi:hypothetical protein
LEQTAYFGSMLINPVVVQKAGSSEKSDLVICYKCGAPFAGQSLPTLEHPRFGSVGS